MKGSSIKERLKSLSQWHYVLLSFILAGSASAIMSLLIKGRLSYDYLITGVVVSQTVFLAILFINKGKQDTPFYDALTGLPNRTLFYDRLCQGIHEAERNRTYLAIMFLSITHFKLINDSLGNDFGNRLLQEVAERLKGSLRKTDTIARPGRNEFMVLLREIGAPEDAGRVAEKLLFALKPPFLNKRQELFLNISIGISLYPDDNNEAEVLIKNAYTAMSYAQEKGENNYHFYSPVIAAIKFEKLVLENSLKRAIERNEFVLYYQPQFALNTGEISGMEALIRWQHPDMGLVGPMRFIPTAEETGLIIPIGQWVLHTACAQNKAWQIAGLKPIRIAVNISVRQFYQHDFVETVVQILKETGLEPEFLELEITENILMRNDVTISTALGKLKEIGIHISIDDFGTGYSSLSYLKFIPVDKLKIVHSFMSSVAIDPKDAAIAATIVNLANSFGLRTIAEGVETKEQLEFLRSLKCTEVQGFLLSKPLTAEDAQKFLSKDKLVVECI